MNSTAKPNDSVSPTGHEVLDSQTDSNSRIHIQPRFDMPMSANVATRNETQSQSARLASHGPTPSDTSEKALHRESTPMERIETGTDEVSDKNEEDDHPATLTETVKQVTHRAKRRMYLHHRHQRHLSKQFTPGSAFKHLPWTHRKHLQVEQDIEAQTDTDEEEGLNLTVWQNIGFMFTTFPYWNMAFWSGWCYSIGSALFVIDGAWSWTPQQWPDSEFKGESKYGVPLIFFFGACLYQVGGVMAYLEAVNDGSFAGAAMKKLFQGHQEVEKEFLDAKLHTFFGHVVPHHHHDDDDAKNDGVNETDSHWDSLQKKDASPEEIYAEAQSNIAKTQSRKNIERRGGVSDQQRRESTAQGDVREYLTWRWWPTWHGLRTYHVRELGYLACAIQLFGVTLYGVTSIVILPGILDSLAWWQELAAYWYPALIASCCFLIASFMFTIMAQEKWNRPKGRAVSWWIGIWAIAGSVGFLLNAVFGILSNSHPWAEYQSSLSSMWGSFFYMLSGLFQWYEAINTNVGPVLAFPNNRTPVLLRSKS